MRNTAEQIKKLSNNNPTAIGIHVSMRIINSQRSDVSKIHGKVNHKQSICEWNIMQKCWLFHKRASRIDVSHFKKDKNVWMFSGRYFHQFSSLFDQIRTDKRFSVMNLWHKLGNSIYFSVSCFKILHYRWSCRAWTKLRIAPHKRPLKKVWT